jgi:hypothetical protein
VREDKNPAFKYLIENYHAKPKNEQSAGQGESAADVAGHWIAASWQIAIEG